METITIMKIITKLVVCILFCIIEVNTVSSQSLKSDYRAAIGLRAGETSGITFKFNTGSYSSLEIIAGIWSDWLNITGLYEKKADAFKVDGMKWYYGAGGHVGFATGTYYQGGRVFNRGDDYSLGIDGIVGLEYKISPIPFAISIDIKPLMEINRNGDIYFGLDPGIGVKFTF